MFILITSIVVLCLALPRFIAGIYSAYPQFIQDRIDTESFKLANNAYSDLYHSVTQANNWSESSINWRLLSQLQTEEYFTRFDWLTDVEKKSLLARIEIAIIDGLKLSPIDPYSWYRLARIRQIEGFPSEDIIKAIEMSIFTQRMAPDLFIQRISLLLSFKTDLNESLYAMLLAQIRLAWQFKRHDLVALVAQHINDKPLFNKAFSNYPEEWQALEKSLENYFKQNQKSK